MYAYCGNNPVMYVDKNGDFPVLIVLVLAIYTIVGGLIGAFVVPTDQKQNIINEEEKDYNDEEPSNESEIDLNDRDDTGQRIINTIVGAGLGLAAGGAMVATGGVLVGAINGVGTIIGGVTATQSFAIGALAFDFSTLFILPIFGIEIDPIEYEKPLPPATK